MKRFVSFEQEAGARLKSLALLLLVLLALCGTGSFVPAAGAVTVDDFLLDVTPTGMTAGPDGNMWITTDAPSILRVAPRGDTTVRYPLTALPGGVKSVGNPTFVGGSLWFTIYRVDDATHVSTMTLGRRAPDGTIVEGPLPPSTGPLVLGSDGVIWFLVAGGVGRLNADGQVKTFGGIPGSTIASDSAGGVWVVPGGQSVTHVTAAGVVTQLDLPGSVWAVATSPLTSAVWFAGRGALCCYGPGSFEFALWLTPGSTGTKVVTGFPAFLQNLAIGPDGNAWASDDDGRIARVSTSGRFTMVFGGASPARSITAGPDGTLWFITGPARAQPDPRSRVWRITLDRPLLAAGPVVDVGETAAGVSAVVTPRGVASRIRFEYGATVEYGGATRWRDVGDGDDPVTRSARLEGLAPGTTYHYRAVVTSALGTSASPDSTLATRPTPPLPPAPPADVDGDGYAAAIDCNDAAVAVFPGAVEIPGDGVDQDCVGGDAPLPRFFPHVTAYFTTKARRWSRFTSLTVDDVPAGAGVQLRCSGPGCRFAAWSSRVRRDRRALKLLSHLAGSRLGPSAVLELRLTLPGHVGTVVRWKVGPPPRPLVTCLAPGARRARRC